ncbi:DUF805 domain-containing protein [Duganella sp. Root198D2]|uniref:DUF805 domain-containing protein n=1 Tax=Duganella sp. Root198D2 TaxID=1736489 RepID=UPI00070FE2D9|nr:DUF805 domain-containing protein [Duganella sp. Root198D2]KRB83417.1 hypothetical protein ASE26_13205 [Duganella sp. Root198D2]
MHNPYAAPQAALELPFAPANQARLFSWNGRIGRLHFVAYCMLGIPVTVLYAIAIAFGLSRVRQYIPAESSASDSVIFTIPLVFLLAIVLATRRRLHDIEVSSWWALLLLFPIFQFIFLIYLLVAPGTPEANRFGALPAPADWGVKLGVALGGALLFGFTALRFL